MKANYTIDREDGKVRKNKMVMSKDDVANALQEEWSRKEDLVYANAKRDCSAQIIAVFFTVMNKEHGWGKKRLIKLKESVESMFQLMEQGIFGKKFDPVDCINYIRDEFGIDLDKEEIMK